MKVKQKLQGDIRDFLSSKPHCVAKNPTQSSEFGEIPEEATSISIQEKNLPEGWQG